MTDEVLLQNLKLGIGYVPFRGRILTRRFRFMLHIRS
jgi:hypothetical protein